MLSNNWYLIMLWCTKKICLNYQVTQKTDRCLKFEALKKAIFGRKKAAELFSNHPISPQSSELTPPNPIKVIFLFAEFESCRGPIVHFLFDAWNDCHHFRLLTSRSRNFSSISVSVLSTTVLNSWAKIEQFWSLISQSRVIVWGDSKNKSFFRFSIKFYYCFEIGPIVKNYDHPNFGHSWCLP